MGLLRRLIGAIVGNVPEDTIPENLGSGIDEHGNEFQIYAGPRRHDQLTSDQLRRIARLRDVLKEAYPMTLDAWVDGFCRDANPESEICIIEAIAVVYQQLLSDTKLRRKAKQRLYGVLCVLSTGVDLGELQGAIPKSLPPLQVIDEMYRDARRDNLRP